VLYKDEHVNGLKADKLFLKEGIELPKEVKLNDMLDISFNMRGRVEMIYKA
jgi:sRNA-binding regulator protein Hfq